MIKHKTVRGREYYQLIQWLSNKSKKKIKQKVRNYLARNTLYNELEDMIKGLNRKIIGWRNYYGLSRWDKLVQIDRYILYRLIIWYNQKRQERKKQEYYKLCVIFRQMGLAKLAV